jgi:hypothetical protein
VVRSSKGKDERKDNGVVRAIFAFYYERVMLTDLSFLERVKLKAKRRVFLARVEVRVLKDVDEADGFLS